MKKLQAALLLGTAMTLIEYFQPLMGYLKEQNQGKSCGWSK